MSTGFVWLSLESTTVPIRAILSVRYTAISGQKFSRFWTMHLLSATGAIKRCAVSVRQTGELTVETTRGCGDDIDRKPSTEYKHLNPHATCACISCSVTIVNITLFVLVMFSCYLNSQILFSLFSHQIPNYNNRYLYCFPFKCVL